MIKQKKKKKKKSANGTPKSTKVPSIPKKRRERKFALGVINVKQKMGNPGPP